MTQYKSFENSKKKLQTSWEQSQENTNQINNNLKIIDTDFNSINFNKKTNTIVLLDDYIISGTYRERFEFPNFPDWAINHSKLSVFFRLDSAYPITEEVDDFFTEFENGTLKTGDFTIFESNTFVKHWWEKSGTTWFLNMRLKADARYAVVSNIGFSTIPIAVYTTAKLQIINERFYETIQSGK